MTSLLKLGIILMRCFLASPFLLFLHTYGDSNILPDDLPSYFDRGTWEEIGKQNGLFSVTGKIAVVVDGPVKYVETLSKKNYDNTVEKVINVQHVLDTVHGTAVAGLVVGDIVELPCVSSHDKTCPKISMYVSGIARSAKLISFPFYVNKESNEHAFTRVKTKIKKLANRKSKSNAQRNFPAKIIINLSVGIDELLQRYFNGKKDLIVASKVIVTNKTQEIMFYDWYLVYLKNKNNWSIPNNTLSDKWEKFQYECDEESRKVIEDANIEYSSLMGDGGLLSGIDKLVVVAAGNGGRELPYEGEGFTARRIGKDSFDPVIRVAASCNDNKELCKFSNHRKDLIDIAAPGKNIPVMIINTTNDKVPYATYVDGTSFSAPLVTGTLLLLSICNPSATITTLKDALFKSALVVTRLQPFVSGGRVLDVKKALTIFCKLPPALHSENPSFKREENQHDDENIEL